MLLYEKIDWKIGHFTCIHYRMITDADINLNDQENDFSIDEDTNDFYVDEDTYDSYSKEEKRNEISDQNCTDVLTFETIQNNIEDQIQSISKFLGISADKSFQLESEKNSRSLL